MKSVGLNSSYIDENELVSRGMKEPYWKMVCRGIINPLSFENKIFRDNLIQHLDDEEQEEAY